MRVVVIGGGIAGLAAAWEAAARRHEVAVLESEERLGGRIRTSEFLGLPVDEAADAFITRTPAAVELCREIGLDDLIAPATGRAHLWVRGELRPIPDGTVLGVPADLDSVKASGVLSDEGLARAAAEPTAVSEPLTGDTTIGALVRSHYGDEVADYLVDPLLGGINAGGIDNLSVDVAAPQIAAVARRSTSLLEGLAAVRAAAPPPGHGPPVFQAPAGGMERLIDALSSSLREQGAELRTSEGAHRLTRHPSSGWTVTTQRGDDVVADAVVVAVPAGPAGALLHDVAGDVAERLAAIPYASVVLLTVGYRADAVRAELEGSGFLVPKPEGRLLTAASWFSNKWAHLDDGRHVIVRASAGRFGDDRALRMADDELVAAVHAELAEVMEIVDAPMASRVSRWSRAFPQFGAGHLDRIAALEQALDRSAPGIALAGSYLRGVGIPACIAGGRAAATRLLGG